MKPRRRDTFGQNFLPFRDEVVRRIPLEIIPRSLLPNLVGGIDRLLGEQSTIVLATGQKPFVGFFLPCLSLVFNNVSPEIDVPQLTIYSLKCEEIPRVSKATSIRVRSGVMSKAFGWSKFHQSEDFAPTIQFPPVDAKWVIVPFIEHIKPTLNLTDTCVCCADGSFLTHSPLFSTLATHRKAGLRSSEVAISSKYLSAAIVAQHYEEMCVTVDSVWLKNSQSFARISHSTAFNTTFGLATTTSFDEHVRASVLAGGIPESYLKEKTELRFVGSGNRGMIYCLEKRLFFMLDEPLPPFDFTITDGAIVLPFLMLAGVDIYLPKTRDGSIGFQYGEASTWMLPF